MDKSRVLKIAGFLVIPLLVMTLGFYFLYPYLNETKYDQIVSEFEQQDTVSTTFDGPIHLSGDSIKKHLEKSKSGKANLQQRIDSLQSVEDSLEKVIENLRLETDKQEEQQQKKKEDNGLAAAGVNIGKSVESTEKFAERVKSLLNLDQQELSPIVNQMSDDQLVRLYNGGGTIQREKLLRSLKPERAAKLMTEIML